ncbi:MAG TPA: YceI family protein [Solirubrobacteraceae bacterium]|jgi:polyisoprenoid-binding protein YceI|nr:YceI family protein [Solirubrobacteraceae bacterium]
MSTATTTEGRLSTGTWKIDRIHSHVGFAVKHMVVSTFRGGFEDYDGELTVGEDGAPKLEGWVAADSVKVRDENLAAHLTAPDFFDTERYPRVTFSSSAVRVNEGGQLEVEGELEIKGHKRPVSARGSVSGPHVDIAGNDKLGVELEATIDRREFGLEWNAPLPQGGFALDNDVKLEVSLELVREA